MVDLRLNSRSFEVFLRFFHTESTHIYQTTFSKTCWYVSGLSSMAVQKFLCGTKRFETSGFWSCLSSGARQDKPFFWLRLRKSPGFNANPEFKSAPTFTNGREFTTASTTVQTDLANALSEGLLRKSHETFIKASHPGGQFNSKHYFIPLLATSVC